MTLTNFQKRFYTSIVLLSLIFLIFKFNIILVYFLIILGIFSILEFMDVTKRLSISLFKLYLINLIFIFYVFVFCLNFFLISNLAGLKIILLILLLACVASDIGGFIFGKIFKGPKLTKISPNKTYSGAIGSIILALITVLFLTYYFVQIIDFKIMIVAIMTSIFCQIGDLTFSFLKRKAKLQDTGKILPGHGGILDRLDGILLGVPLGFLTFVLIY